MCGLVGVLGQYLNTPEERVFQQMLICDVLRGKHSTGMISVNRKGEVGWRKQAADAYSFLMEPESIKWFTDTKNAVAYLGHNRAATVGKVSTANAHPFSEGDITLCHNGTLAYTSTLPDHKKFDVDSHAICNAIDKLGIEETAKRLCGAWAISYVNEKDNTINFLRNGDRPLFFARLRSKYGQKNAVNKWVYASEKGLMQWILERNDMEVVNYFALKTHTLMTFDIDGDFSSPRFTKLTYDEDDLPVTTYTAPANNRQRVGGAAQERPKAQPQTLPSSPPNQSTGNGTPSTTVGSTSPKDEGRNASGSQTLAQIKVGRFSQGDSVPFWPECFTLDHEFSSPFDNNAIGTVRGFMAEFPYYEVRASRVLAASVNLRWSKATSKWILADGEYEAQMICCVPAGKKGKDSMVVLRASTITQSFAFEEKEDDTPMVLTCGNVPWKGEDSDDLELHELEQEDFDDVKHGKVISMYDRQAMVKGPTGLYIPVSKYNEMVEEGCSNCGNPLDSGDAESLFWLEKELPVCETCQETFKDELGIAK